MRLERVVAADREWLWRYVGDLDRWHELLPTVDSVTRTGPPGPIGVGTRVRVAQPRLATAEYVVTAWDPPAGFTWATTVRGARTTACHEPHATRPCARLVLCPVGRA